MEVGLRPSRREEIGTVSARQLARYPSEVRGDGHAQGGDVTTSDGRPAVSNLEREKEELGFGSWAPAEGTPWETLDLAGEGPPTSFLLRRKCSRTGAAVGEVETRRGRRQARYPSEGSGGGSHRGRR